MSDTETVVEEAASEEVMPTMEEDLGAIFDEIQEESSEDSGRDERGRFKAKESTEQEVSDIQPDAEIGATEEVELEPLEAPAALSATAQTAWAALPREFQEEILKREGERAQIEGERANLQPIEAAIEPLREQLRLDGQEPGQYVAQLVAADRYLRTSPREAMQWIANQYGIDLSQPQAESQQVDPALAPFVTEINALKSQLSQFATSQQQAEAQRVHAEIEAFAKDHPHLDEVRAQMGALIGAGTAKDMAEAYDMAVWANPSTRAKIQAETSAAAEQARKEETEAKAAKAKRVVAGNLSSNGTAGGATPPQFKTREEELASIYDNVQGA